MRAFIAIDVKRVEDFLKYVNSNIKAGAIKSFHLTLKFLGDVHDNRLDAIIKALNNIEFNKFALNLSDIGFFPNSKHPRIVFAGVKPWKEIIALQKKIDESMQAIGFQKDRKFHPHITLARVKNKFSMEQVIIEPKTINVDSFKLIKSTLTPDGPVYKTIKTFINKS